MVILQYFNGTNWQTLSTWWKEELAWASLGGDNMNYRTVDDKGRVLTDKSL